MARDLEKRLVEGERLFKQGKAPVAVRELRQLAEDSGSEPLVLNRVGDVLARNGCIAEAVACYDRIAEDFSRAGFFPKSVAVLKKTLRISPDHLPAVLLLGEVYVRQDVRSEARNHLLRAAERFLKAHQTAEARAVYEKLAEIDPQDPLHHVRVAEAKIVAGETGEAASDLLNAGTLLLRAGRVSEAEKTFRRAAEVAPARTEAKSGIARCLVEQSKGDEAIALLEEASRRPGAPGALLGELCFLYERVGKPERTAAILAAETADQIPAEALEEIVRVHAKQGRADEGWRRIAPLLDRWAAARQTVRLVPALNRLAEIDGQEVTALERLRAVLRDAGQPESLVSTLERLVRAYWARQAHGPASAALEELKQLAPGSALAAESVSRRSVGSVATAEVVAVSAPPPAAVPVLAVPESNADREFVSGRLTEAEAFVKYNLPDSAEQQLRDVTRRFPGHVEAQGRLASLLRSRKDMPGLQATLVNLALARISGGDAAGAHEAAKSAALVGPLSDAARLALTRAGVFTEQRPVPKPPPAAPPAAHAALGAAAPDEPEIEILFGDDEPLLEAPDGLLTAPSGDLAARVPPSDALEEIAFFLDHGMHAEALERIVLLRKGGFGGDRLDFIERKAALTGGGGPLAPSSAHARLNEEELIEISEALESGMTEERESGKREAQPESSESVDDVFAAFKEQVAGEIDSGDYRAHYDLGIAYKEMGLLDDAIREFDSARSSPSLHREACSMLGLCHRERGDADAAVRWYRAALEVSDPASSENEGLRYALADALVALGEDQAALELFARILAEHPGYRDVPARISALRGRIRP